ncbi:hypothetical protein CMI47_12700 [Candidatus Pacearchaeota archaeon]|nr:hypothetical protein [Candidatus Pacearchaeota archaeon]
MKCFKAHQEYNAICNKKSCKYWINSECDFNCTIIATSTSPKTFEEIASMYNLTKMRICQIQHNAVAKIKNKLKNYQ